MQICRSDELLAPSWERRQLNSSFNFFFLLVKKKKKKTLETTFRLKGEKSNMKFSKGFGI